LTANSNAELRYRDERSIMEKLMDFPALLFERPDINVAGSM
jgi:hypothetical protein